MAGEWAARASASTVASRATDAAALDHAAAPCATGVPPTGAAAMHRRTLLAAKLAVLEAAMDAIP
jgi:hypothetical protein